MVTGFWTLRLEDAEKTISTWGLPKFPALPVQTQGSLEATQTGEGAIRAPGGVHPTLHPAPQEVGRPKAPTRGPKHRATLQPWCLLRAWAEAAQGSRGTPN